MAAFHNARAFSARQINSWNNVRNYFATIQRKIWVETVHLMALHWLCSCFIPDLHHIHVLWNSF